MNCDELIDTSGYGITIIDNDSELEITDQKVTFDIPLLNGSTNAFTHAVVITDYEIKNETNHSVTKKVYLPLGTVESYRYVSPFNGVNTDKYSFTVNGQLLNRQILLERKDFDTFPVTDNNNFVVDYNDVISDADQLIDPSEYSSWI